MNSSRSRCVRGGTNFPVSSSASSINSARTLRGVAGVSGSDGPPLASVGRGVAETSGCVGLFSARGAAIGSVPALAGGTCTPAGSFRFPPPTIAVPQAVTVPKPALSERRMRPVALSSATGGASAAGAPATGVIVRRASPCFQARSMARMFPGDMPCRSARIPCFCSSGASGNSSSTMAAASGSACRRLGPVASCPVRAGNSPAVVSTLSFFWGSVFERAPIALRPGATSAVTTRLSANGSVRTRGVFISCSVLARSPSRRLPATEGSRDAREAAEDCESRR